MPMVLATTAGPAERVSAPPSLTAVPPLDDDPTPPTRAEHCLNQALIAAEHGYQLTPVTLRRRDDGDKGATFHKRWRSDGASAWSSDPEQIRDWWVQYPDTSFAIRTGPAGGVDVVDLDVKPDANGVEGWLVERGHDLPTMVVETISGGLHLYYPACGLPTSAGNYAPGIDTRGAGGLVYAPGAYIVGEAGTYTAQQWVKVDELTPMDGALAQAIRDAKPPGKSYAADGAIVVKDRDVMGQKCGEQITKLSELPALTGARFRDVQMGAAMMAGRFIEADLADGRSDRTEWMRCRLEDATIKVWGSVSAKDSLNIEQGLADGVAKERWRWRPEEAPAEASSPDPATDPEGYELALQLEVRKARLRRDAAEVLAAEQRPARAPLTSRIVWDDELNTVPLPDMAVSELIAERSVGWLGGPSGSYKSFVGVDLGVHLAYGGQALGHAEFTVNRPRKVLYVAGEGASGVALRLRAALLRAGVSDTRQLALDTQAVDLTSEREVDELVAFVLAQGVTFVIVDTFRQSTPGVNENDNSEVGVILGRLIALRDTHGVSSMLIDHTNKSVKGLADLTGAGAKRANADYVLMIDLPNGSRDADQQRTLRTAKLKDLPDGRSWPIRLEPVPEVADAKGNPSAVVVVSDVDLVAARPFGDGTPAWRDPDGVPVPEDIVDYRGKGKRAVPDLARFMRENAVGGIGMSLTDARAALLKVVDLNGEPVHERMSVSRAWGALFDLGRITRASAGEVTGRSYWVAKDGDPE
jgi:hypothetical protein